MACVKETRFREPIEKPDEAHDCVKNVEEKSSMCLIIKDDHKMRKHF